MEMPLNCIPTSIRETFDESDLDFLKHQIEANIEAASTNHEEIKSLFEFAKFSKLVKGIGSDIDQNVLEDAASGTIYDFRINCKGPDDKVYLSNPSIREKVTRGLSFLEITTKDKATSLDLIIYANRKFSGNTGDDDDYISEDDGDWRKYCLESSQQATSIVCTTKLNGEAAHLSGRMIGTTFYYCIGSKNVHMLIRKGTDILRYTNSRYKIASVAAKAIMKTLNTLSQDSLQFLQSLLHFTKITIVFEILQPQYQHIIDLSSLEEVTPCVLMCCPTASPIYKKSLTAITPHLTLKMAQALGFKTTNFEILTLGKLQDKITQIRSERDTEGAVLYYVNKSHETVGLIKLKSCWYVLLRALREKADFHLRIRKNKPSVDMNKAITSTRKRFKQIQSWLRFSNEFLNEWQNLGEHFLTWLQNEIKEGRVIHGQIRPEYPHLWKTFLTQTKKSDNVELSL